MLNIKHIIAIVLSIALMFIIGLAIKADDPQEYLTEDTIDQTYDITLVQTTPQTSPPETIIETTYHETTAEETTEPETTEPQTEVILEYYVEEGNVWIDINVVPESDVAVLVTTLIEIPVEPETDNSYVSSDPDTEATPETEPVIYEPIVKPERDDYETNGPYAPVSLMYHSINEVPFTSLTGLFVRPVDFEDHLVTLNALGYEYIFADEFTHTENPSVMLTFDDGYEDNYTEMFPILKKYNAKATIFMVTSAIDRPGYLTSEQIKEMADSGLVRFASHTHNHYSLTSLSEKDLRYQFEHSKQILKELTGHEMDAICYPGGSVSEYVTQIAEDYYCYGYTTINSANTYDCDPMLIPRLRISRDLTGQGLASLLGY